MFEILFMSKVKNLVGVLAKFKSGHSSFKSLENKEFPILDINGKFVKLHGVHGIEFNSDSLLFAWAHNEQSSTEWVELNIWRYLLFFGLENPIPYFMKIGIPIFIRASHGNFCDENSIYRKNHILIKVRNTGEWKFVQRCELR